MLPSKSALKNCLVRRRPGIADMENRVQVVVISGRSGSGKTVALRALEDLGFYSIDNLPIVFLEDLLVLAKEHYHKLAVSIDIRNLPHNISKLTNTYLITKKDPAVSSTIIYIDAEDQVLIKRYAETRRLHPLSRKSLSLDEAISKENELLSQIASIADLKIDTSAMTLHDLATQITTLIQGKPEKQLVIVFESFGFKYGTAKDADFLFDTRFLPNPYWEKELRIFSGLHPKVQKFFSKYPQVEKYISLIDNMLMEWLPQIAKSNRSYLTVAIGCTGGFHRSVFIAQALADRFKDRGIPTRVRHKTLIKMRDEHRN